jgi:hypothetical protein
MAADSIRFMMLRNVEITSLQGPHLPFSYVWACLPAFVLMTFSAAFSSGFLLHCSLMQLVYEKEKKLRMMMKMHGLGDSAYWLVTYCWFLALYCVYVFIFMLFGSLIGLNMFRKNSYGKSISQVMHWLHEDTPCLLCRIVGTSILSFSQIPDGSC